MTSASGKKVAIVIGGSVGGLFAATLLRRTGWDTIVLERSEISLATRGTGIARHDDLERILAKSDVADAGAAMTVEGRVAYDRSGARVGWHAHTQQLGAWNQVFIPLHQNYPTELYRQGETFTKIAQDADGVTVHTTSGEVLRGDIVIGADGFLSSVRAEIAPEITPHYAGYVAWRGVSDEMALDQEFRDGFMTNYAFLFPKGGQYIGYPMAGPSGQTTLGNRQYNYLWYTPEDDLKGLLTAKDGSHSPYSIAPHGIQDNHFEALHARAKELLPEIFAQTVTEARTTMVQPIYDVVPERLVYGRVLLLGDAAFVVRPHVGIGVLKAAQDAECLADSLDRYDDLDEALGAYNTERMRACTMAADHGQLLGAFIERGLPDPEADPVLGLTIPRILAQSGRPLPENGYA